MEVTDATFQAEVEQHKGLAVVDFCIVWLVAARYTPKGPGASAGSSVNPLRTTCAFAPDGSLTGAVSQTIRLDPLPSGRPSIETWAGTVPMAVKRRDRLGGLLHEYHRAA